MSDVEFDLSRSSDCGPEFDLSAPSIDEDDEEEGGGADSSPTFDLTPDAPCASVRDFHANRPFRHIDIGSVQLHSADEQNVAKRTSSKFGWYTPLVGQFGSPENVERCEPEWVDVAKRTSPDSGRFGAENTNISSDAETALSFVEGADRHTKEIVTALIDDGNDSLARRFAACETEFPYHSPRLCDHCRSLKGGAVRRQYIDVVEQWDNPTSMTLTIERPFDSPIVARETVEEALNSLRRRKLPLSDEWLSQLAADDTERAGELRREYFNQGLSVPFSELATAGIAGVHVEQNRGMFTVHVDVFADALYIPQDALSEVWGKCLPVGVEGSVDVRRATPREGNSRREMCLRLLAYVIEKTEIHDPKELADYVDSLIGKHTYLPWGLSDN